MDRSVVIAIEYAVANWQVLSGAPLPFLLALLVGFACAFFAAKWRFGGLLDHKKAEIENLTSQIKLLQTEKDSFTKNATPKLTSPPNNHSVEFLIETFVKHIQSTSSSTQNNGIADTVKRIDSPDTTNRSMQGSPEPRPIFNLTTSPVSNEDEATVLAAFASRGDHFTSVTELRQFLKGLPLYKILKIVPALEQKNAIERDPNSAVLRYRIVK